MEYLPKLLKIAMDQLFEEKELHNWNIQSHGETVYINMKFVSHGFDTSTPAPMGFRKKSPAEKRRDSQRLLSFQNSKRDSDITESKYVTSTARKDYQVKEHFIDQCYSPLSQATGDLGHGQTVICESNLPGENQNKSHRTCSTLDSSSETSIGHEIDSTPYLDQTSTQPLINENTDLVSPIDDIPEATGIHCKDYDHSTLFTRIVIDGTDDGTQKLLGFTKQSNIAVYDLSDDGEHAFDTFSLLKPHSDCYKMYKEIIVDSHKNNMIYSCYDQSLKKHLDNTCMFEMTRDYCMFYPLRMLTKRLSESVVIK